jgi:hypothetical protein
MAGALRPLGIELRHFAVLLVLVNRGPTEQRDLVEATGSDNAGIMRVVDDLERKGLAVRKSVPGDRRVRAVRSHLRALSSSTQLTWPRSHWLSAWFPCWGPARPRS